MATLSITKGMRKPLKRQNAGAYTALDFESANKTANKLADRIEAKFEALAHILLEYESYEVVRDEISRTLDLLRSLRENEEYFKLRVGGVTSFLPRNQPLYALSCFVLVPALMASEVHFRIPHSMRHFFPKLLAALDITALFPNVVVSNKERTEFLTERSAIRLDPKTKESHPVTDVVIYTGSSAHANQLRMVFDERTLFIFNGSGHNPMVVSRNAKLINAAKAAIDLQFYNQGQDCSAPNAILVHATVFDEFMRLIRDEIRVTRVGNYADRSCRVGPISEPKDLVRIEELLIRNRMWLDPTTPGIVRAYDAIVEPTIIAKPLKNGGNFMEVFAPVMFLQKYNSDSELKLYFEDPLYEPNAMFISLFGTSAYIKRLTYRSANGRVLHPEKMILHDTHPHADGVERGTQEYGGYGAQTSSISHHGTTLSKPTLPQRDIYEWIEKPILESHSAEEHATNIKRFTAIREKDVQKLLRLKSVDMPVAGGKTTGSTTYIDLQALKSVERRYAKLEEDYSFHLLDAPNAKFISKLKVTDLKPIRALRKALLKGVRMPLEDFNTYVYALPTEAKMSAQDKKENQLRFFQNLYGLLFGESSGPRLAQFLLEVDQEKVCALLDI